MVTKEEFNRLKNNRNILIDYLEDNGEYLAATLLKTGSRYKAEYILFPKFLGRYYPALKKVTEWILCSGYNPRDLDIVVTVFKETDDQYLYQEKMGYYYLTVKNKLWDDDQKKLERCW